MAGASAGGPELAGRKGGSGTAAVGDRSAKAVQRQVTAISIDRFVLTLVNSKTGVQEERHWHKEEVLKSVAWLKRMNARGYDIRIRPDGEHGLALLGGLNKADVRVLHERGFAPAAVVEITTGQYEAWVKLSQKPLAEPVRDQAAQGLVRGLGIYSAAKTISLVEGRLAGFTKQDVQRTSGRHPFVLLAEAEGRLAPAAPAYLAKFTQEKVRAQEPRYNGQRARSGGRGR
nr:DNA-primase RepB domain-containing protein [Duganella margarita]